MRKNPCRHVRFRPTDGNTTQDARTFVHRGPDSLHQTGRIAGWVL